MAKHNLKNKKISIILPTYNEVENIEKIYNQLMFYINQIGILYEIIFIDDNSPDGTMNEIKKLREKDSNVKYLFMAKRCGDQKSLMAGIDVAQGDFVVTMDSDLQHPPEYLPKMVEKWIEGSSVVIMKRMEAGHNNAFKKWTEIIFYKILRKISKTDIHYRFAGFALLDKKVVSNLRRFKESEPFLRGLISLVGYNHTELFYKEAERAKGKSKYRFISMLRLGISGITSFSEFPLYLSFYFGIVVMLLSLIYVIIILIQYLFFQILIPPGWVSTMVVVIFLGGVQLFSIGLLGIYTSKIFIETKRRPNYIIFESGGIEYDER